MYFEAGDDGGSAGSMTINTLTNGGRFNIRVELDRGEGDERG